MGTTRLPLWPRLYWHNLSLRADFEPPRGFTLGTALDVLSGRGLGSLDTGFASRTLADESRCVGGPPQGLPLLKECRVL